MRVKVEKRAVKLSKKQSQRYALVNKTLQYSIGDGIKLLKQMHKPNFDPTINVAINLGIDPRQSDQNVRASVTLPHGTGKKVRVAVFAVAVKAEEAIKAGADIVGADDLIEQIKSGKINFDRCIATPDMMPKLSAIAKILGPKGLMPNPKLGTVTMDIATAVKNSKAGQVEFRAEKAGIVHAGVAKMSFSDDKIEDNIKYLINAIVKAKPAGAKGTYVKAVFISFTMGASVKIDVSSLVN